MSIRDLSEATGIKYRTIQNYLADERAPGAEFLLAMSTQLGISASWILGGVGEMHLNGCDLRPDRDLRRQEFVRVSKLTVSNDADNISFVGDVMDDTPFAFRADWIERRGLNDGELYVVEVRGDSNAPTLKHGDNVLIDCTQCKPEDAATYAVRIGDEQLIRIVQRTGKHSIVLLSHNPIYPPREFALPLDPDDCEIIGRVVASMRDW